jgi:hypothetical protein
MFPTSRFAKLWIAAALIAAGCSSSGGGGTGGAGGGSAAGTNGRGGTTGSAGTKGVADGSVGPDGASGGAAGQAIPDAAIDTGASLTCSGTLLDPRPFDECEDGFCRCRSYAPDGGSLTLDTSIGANDGITSLLLPVAMKAGQVYSLSAMVSDSNFGGTIEFWGTNSECGPGLQKLFSAPVASQTFCADVAPSQDFTYVLYVEHLLWDGGAAASESTGAILASPDSRCPAAGT